MFDETQGHAELSADDFTERYPPRTIKLFQLHLFYWPVISWARADRDAWQKHRNVHVIEMRGPAVELLLGIETEHVSVPSRAGTKS